VVLSVENDQLTVRVVVCQVNSISHRRISNVTSSCCLTLHVMLRCLFSNLLSTNFC